MTTVDPKTLTAERIIARFADIGVAQDNALLANEYGRFNRLFREMRTIVDELKRRPGDQRTALLALYGHENIQVRLQAARMSLDVAPAAARSLIESIANSKQFPQAGDAGMTIRFLDRQLSNSN